MLRNLIKRRFGRILWPVAGACLSAYFIFYLLQGDRGLVSMLHLKKQVRDAQATLDSETEKRDRLAEKVQHLNPESLDIDMLDERARATLGYASPNDIVIPMGDEQRTGAEAQPPQQPVPQPDPVMDGRE